MDNSQFLTKLKDKIDSVGLEMPKKEVWFDHLNDDADASDAEPFLLL